MNIPEMVAAIKPLMKGIDRRITEIAEFHHDPKSLATTRWYAQNGIELTRVEGPEDNWIFYLMRDGRFMRSDGVATELPTGVRYTYTYTAMNLLDVHRYFEDRQIQSWLIAILQERKQQAMVRLAAIDLALETLGG